MSKNTLGTILALVMMIAGNAHAADPDAGKKTYKRTCIACHGNKAQGAASFPKLSDKSVEYLSDKLVRYRSGETLGPNTRLMAPNAAKLSDDDIANVTAYIASLAE